jgi:hypothetical protein
VFSGRPPVKLRGADEDVVRAADLIRYPRHQVVQFEIQRACVRYGRAAGQNIYSIHLPFFVPICRT